MTKTATVSRRHRRAQLNAMGYLKIKNQLRLDQMKSQICSKRFGGKVRFARYALLHAKLIADPSDICEHDLIVYQRSTTITDDHDDHDANL